MLINSLLQGHGQWIFVIQKPPWIHPCRFGIRIRAADACE